MYLIESSSSSTFNFISCAHEFDTTNLPINIGKKSFLLGRITDPTIEESHCLIDKEDQKIIAKDTSKYGTYIKIPSGTYIPIEEGSDYVCGMTWFSMKKQGSKYIITKSDKDYHSENIQVTPGIITIGRGVADTICVKDDTLSVSHLKISISSSGTTIMDSGKSGKGSLNG